MMLRISMAEQLNLKLKLSEFLHYINYLGLVCDGDPDVEFEVNGSKVILDSMTMTLGPCDFAIERGGLRKIPDWDETLLIRLEARDG
jgi:hypothetical protein